MCNGCKTCACNRKMLTLYAQAAFAKLVKFNGEDTLVVPLVMAKESVVMNDALVPIEEWEAMAWNGRPVTVGHPDNNGQFLSASSSPQAAEDWVVGQLFNARVEGGEFKADAYVSIRRAKEIHPELIKGLQSEKYQLNVSTGYFADVEEAHGELNGKSYTMVHKNLRPDHLALLPNEVGACSWADGCGVRNKRGDSMSKLKKGLLAIQSSLAALIANERGSPTDRGQMVADLISSNASPFLPEDMEGLNKLCDQSLQKLCTQYLSDNAVDSGDAEPDPEDPNEEGADTGGADDKEPKMNKSELAALIKSEVANALKGVGLSDADKAALAAAHKSADANKAALVEKIVANSTMERAAVEKFDLATLETIANGLVVTAVDFSGRSLPARNAVSDDAEIVKGMAPLSFTDAVRNRNKKEKA